MIDLTILLLLPLGSGPQGFLNMNMYIQQKARDV
jgi:hypothetical protein